MVVDEMWIYYELSHTEICAKEAFFLEDLVEQTFVVSLRAAKKRRDKLRDALSVTPLTTRTTWIVHDGLDAHKPGVTTTMDDLLHAVKYACSLAADSPKPVLVLEDDAEFRLTRSDAWAATCAALAPGVDAVSLGSIMHLTARAGSFGQRDFLRVHCGGGAHAMLLGPRARQAILDMPFKSYMPHDFVLYSRLNILAPVRPLAAQRHTRTENSRTYDPLGLSSWLLRLVGFDRDAFRAYDAFHRIGSMGGLLTLGCGCATLAAAAAWIA